MKEKMISIAEKNIHEAQDDYAVDKKHMPSQRIRAVELINAILALEVPGRKIISATCEHYCRPTCSPENCMDDIERIKPSSSECHKRRPTTIADIAGGA